MFPEGVTPPKPLPTLTERDAASYIGMSIWYLRTARRENRGPAFVQLGRAVRYRVADLDRWMDRHVKQTRESA